MAVDLSETGDIDRNTAIAHGAKQIQAGEGPAYWIWDQSKNKALIRKALFSNQGNITSFRLAVDGVARNRVGFFQCKMCCRYFRERHDIGRHLENCVSPEWRLKNKRWAFPKDANGRYPCILCNKRTDSFTKMALHICHTHYEDEIDLHRCGIDIILITHQYTPVTMEQ